MLKVKHVPLYKRLLDLLTRPCDVQLVVMVSLKDQGEERVGGGGLI